MEVGRLGAPYGVRGWLHFRSFTDPVDNLKDYRPWWLGKSASHCSPAEVLQAKAHGKGFVVNLKNVETREDALALRNLSIWVRREDLPEPETGDIFWVDLIGCEVLCDTAVLGTVVDLLETGAHDVLVVKPEGGTEMLIPYTEPYLLDVDLEQRQVHVQWEQDW